ncbi:unnamed protein product [Somion occarium]|uniref:AFG1-like ATPase n=1 Tax=Somion occarium TaxID=3059160 RepID=A0ABP1DFX1_9APHY
MRSGCNWIAPRFAVSAIDQPRAVGSFHGNSYRKLEAATALEASPRSGLPQTIDLLQTYRGFVSLGKIQHDEEQVRVVMQLRRIQKDLDGYAPPVLSTHYMNFPQGTHGQDSSELQPWWQSPTLKTTDDVTSAQMAVVRRRSHAEELAELTTPKGLLLTGPPGAGKSFIVDLWFNSFPTPFKARKHYNQLVLEIYRAVWEETKIRMASEEAVEQVSEPQPWTRSLRDQWRQLVSTGSLPIKWTRAARQNTSFIASHGYTQQTIAFAVAQRLILRHWLLVFDEIQLLDVSSATLLADVLSWFWRMGGVIIGTSNKVPDDLYMNGVQRERLEPFVEALKVRCPVYVMRSERDWREIKAGDGLDRSWFTYEQKAEFKAKLADVIVEEPTARSLSVFTFSQLCDESLGPADYLTLSSHFHTIVISSIPILKLSAKNQARRFISLIDALYESRCRLICLADAEPAELFFPDAKASLSGEFREARDMDVMMAEAVAETRDVYRPNVSSYDAPNMAEAPEVPTATVPLETLSIFSGKDEQFAFKRALSRLLEMTSESYGKEAEWTPLPEDARKWERASVSGVFSVQPRNDVKHTSREASDTDFASAASYEGHARIAQRPEAPRFREHHAWGMRERQ